MEKIATDTYSFEKLRKNGFTYVDKTEALYEMVSGDMGFQFFIARPRRFGKSLAVLTVSEAMEQIKGKNYAGKYALSGKRITFVGILFSAEKRTIVEKLVGELQS